jgi:hypothetical protein
MNQIMMPPVSHGYSENISLKYTKLDHRTSILGDPVGNTRRRESWDDSAMSIAKYGYNDEGDGDDYCENDEGFVTFSDALVISKEVPDRND